MIAKAADAGVSTTVSGVDAVGAVGVTSAKAIAARDPLMPFQAMTLAELLQFAVFPLIGALWWLSREQSRLDRELVKLIAEVNAGQKQRHDDMAHYRDDMVRYREDMTDLRAAMQDLTKELREMRSTQR